MRKKRYLWASISTSKKVNALSTKAVILYLFTLPHLDDEGFIDACPKILKSKAVPLRDDITVEDVEELIHEIAIVHTKVKSTPTPLWIIHETPHGTFIQDPVFSEKQSFRNKVSSKIKEIIQNNGENDNEENDKKMINSDKMQNGISHFNYDKLSLKEWTSKIVELFNSITENLPKVSYLTKGRLEKLRCRRKEKPEIDFWITVFEKADQIYIPGKNGQKDWYPTFDWLIKNDVNSLKVYEGNYDNAKRPFFTPQTGIAEFYRKEKENEA